MPYAMPHDGEVVGVGEPVAIRFDENIANRDAAEKAIVVTTDPPVEGAFYWLNKREVRWRPEHFWKPGTAVNVAVNTYGVDLGDGVFGEDNLRTHFTIGDEVIATADDTTKMVTVRVNGEVVKTMPTSMGKDSTPTASGIYIVGERFAHMIMDSSTYGVPVNSPNGYRTEVDFATQMSYSGVFVHSAPWSVGAQGHTNTSHGCLNVSPSNAQWFFDHTKRGDIVQVRQYPRPAAVGDRRSWRLEHSVGSVARRQRQGVTRRAAVRSLSRPTADGLHPTPGGELLRPRRRWRGRRDVRRRECGTYAGLGVNQSGGGGGGLHSLVHTLRDQLGSHGAPLTPGAAAITAAIGNNATATPAAKRRTNLVTQASQRDPSPTLLASAYALDTPQTE